MLGRDPRPQRPLFLRPRREFSHAALAGKHGEVARLLAHTEALPEPGTGSQHRNGAAGRRRGAHERRGWSVELHEIAARGPQRGGQRQAHGDKVVHQVCRAQRQAEGLGNACAGRAPAVRTHGWREAGRPAVHDWAANRKGRTAKAVGDLRGELCSKRAQRVLEGGKVSGEEARRVRRVAVAREARWHRGVDDVEANVCAAEVADDQEAGHRRVQLSRLTQQASRQHASVLQTTRSV